MDVSIYYKNYFLRWIILLFLLTNTERFQNILLASEINQPKVLEFKFDLGNGTAAENFQKVGSYDTYSEERGYGFISNSNIISRERVGNNSLTNDFVTCDHPFYFVVDLPEGNYEVRIGLGDPEGKSLTTVKAESRRLMLENIKTEMGETVVKTIWISVRSPKINSEEEIKRKPREFSYLNWDNKLTLEFSNKNPRVNFIEITKLDSARTIFLAGNSTVVDQEHEPWASWGQMLPNFLIPEIVVANFAESGEALLSFKEEKRLRKILSLMKKDDYLFIEFAHNDQKPGSAHLDALTTYKDELKYYINRALEYGGIPVLVTSMHRRKFDENGKIINTLDDYPEAMRQVAKETKTDLIDLNKMSRILFETLGPEKSKKAFVHFPAESYPEQTTDLADNTHFSTYGAYQLAKCVVQEICRLELDLKNYIKNNFTEYNPSNPDPFEDYYWPMSPKIILVKPEGH